jgi:AcrR family transcriptional regulator
MSASAGGSLATPDADEPAAAPPRRRPRRDAEANRERVLAAAAAAMLLEGRNVPLATIAADVGVGTLYRSYADREALLHALEHRAYRLLNQILDQIVDQVDRHGLPGLDAVAEYLSRTLTIADQLVLPLHGPPPLMCDEAVQASAPARDLREGAGLERPPRHARPGCHP